MCQFSRGILILLISGLLTSGKETIKTAKAECTLGNNTECSIRSNQPTLSKPNKSVNWSIGITDTLFSYTLETAENGEDLLVGGIVTCKFLIANWLNEKNQTWDGIRVTLIDEEKNETMQIYDTEIRGEFLVNETTPEFRLDFDNVLRFNKTYRVKVDLLPLGKPTNYAKWNNQQILYVEPRIESQQCEQMTKLAQKWSPQLSIDVYEASSKLSVTWRVAPPSLCIFSYKLTAYNKNRTFFHENTIDDMGNSTFLVDELVNVPRDQRLTVMVNAQVMTFRQCVCPKCNCNHKKRRRIVIPSWKNVTSKPTFIPKILESMSYSMYPSSSPSPQVNQNTLFYSLFILGIVLLIVIAVILCIFSAHTSSRYKEHVFLQIINNIITFNEKKSYRILLVCPNIKGEEKELMERICEAFKHSRHRAVCDKFPEDSRRAEQNMLHWMYRETAACQKMIIFNSSVEHTSHGLHENITSTMTPRDHRVVNVLLSAENVICKYPTETNFTLPRDQYLLEQTYDIQISPVRQSPIPERRVELLIDPLPESLDDHAADTIDSGVSSMSSSSSDTQENFSETLFQSDPDIDLNIKCDNHPLLQHVHQMVV